MALTIDCLLLALVVGIGQASLDQPTALGDYFSGLVADDFLTDGPDVHAEVFALFPCLKRSFEQDGRKSLLVDVGANTGVVLSHMVKTFGEHLWQWPNTLNAVKVHAFEPNPRNFDILSEKLREGVFDFTGISVNVSLTHAALSKFPGRTTFHHFGKGDATGSLSSSVIKHSPHWNVAPSESVEINVLTLDECFNSKSKIHLLKVDAEGFDPLVLQGARRLMKRKSIKFLIFEFSANHWNVAAHGISLVHVVLDLRSLGYICFLISVEVLIPISDFWWHMPISDIHHSDVFCGLAGDNDLFQAYVAWGTNNETLSYAMSYLETGKRKPTRRMLG